MESSFATIKKECDNCQHFVPLVEKDSSKSEYGHCFRFPPILMPSQDTANVTFGHPITKRSAHCGEFTRGVNGTISLDEQAMAMIKEINSGEVK